jgi:hypothetical protein
MTPLQLQRLIMCWEIADLKLKDIYRSLKNHLTYTSKPELFDNDDAFDVFVGLQTDHIKIEAKLLAAKPVITDNYSDMLLFSICVCKDILAYREKVNAEIDRWFKFE